jgi:Leucine-rich repeat (LRR) protein
MMRRSLDISILELTDTQLLNCLTSLQKLRDVTELQIRRNKLSQRGFTMLLNCFPNLETLDVSDSNSKNFFKILGKKLPNLKTLYVNETEMNDHKLKILLQSTNNLRVLYADGNQIGT